MYEPKDDINESTVNARKGTSSIDLEVSFCAYVCALVCVSIGNSMICSDIWHKYHERYFKIVIPNFRSR